MNIMAILLNVYFMKELTELVAVVLVLALPIVIAVLIYRHKRNDTDKRSQVLLTALEKNAGSLPEDLLKSLNQPRKSIKERLLGKLLLGILGSVAGLGLVISAFIICGNDREAMAFNSPLVFGVVVLAVGVAFLVYYFIGRKELRNEIEAEENNLKQ